MSHSYYTELWLATRKDLEKLLELEREQQIARIPYEKQNRILQIALSMYIRYRNLVRRLIMCYDQMVQTQKRELIKRMLDCTIGRMLEYKQEISRLNFTEYQWPGNIMDELKFTSDDIALFASVTGRERMEDRKKFIKEVKETAEKIPEMKERSLSQVLEALEVEEEEEEKKPRAVRKRRPPPPKPVIEESPEEKAAREAKLAAEKAFFDAILLIQKHERARIGRCRGAEVKSEHEYNRKVAIGLIIPKEIDDKTREKAAETIQRAWRRYKEKTTAKKRIARLEAVLGMTIPSWQSRETFEKDEQNFRQKRALIPVHDIRAQKIISNERTRLLRVKAPGLMEDITDEIHEWFMLWNNVTGEYDVFPEKDLGGSILIVTDQTLTPQEFLKNKREEKKLLKTRGGRPKKEIEVPEAKAVKDTFWRMPQTQTLPSLEETNIDFIQNWSLRDESDNPKQNEYLDLITNQLCYELQFEIREIVDDLMRAELELLVRALQKDKSEKPKKRKKPKEKIRRVRKKKEEEPIENLFSELLQANIIRMYPETYLSDWIGDLSYEHYANPLESPDFKHRLGEVKQLALEYCVLPLMSKETHELAPLVRSVCIYGLPDSGKTFLANIICTEIGALLFDVSPEVLKDKYEGKVMQNKLINMINKVARFYAPSIIFLAAGEKPWLKKVPPEEKHLNPKRFARHFTKLVKGIKRGDQIMFLSVSSAPQKASAAFIKIHDRFIRVPTTDYNTLYMFYKNLLMKYPMVDRNIDVSCMAKLSEGIPLNFIRQAVEKVLSLRRRMTLKFNPLKPIEIMREVMTYEYPPMKLVAAFDKFYKRTPLAKRRTRAMKARAAAVI